MFKHQLRNKNIKAVIGYFMIALFVLQVANKALYTHTHILYYGLVISHAHPYDKTGNGGPVADHHHTKQEIIALEYLGILFPFLFLLLSLSRFTLKETISADIVQPYRMYGLLLQKGRSPPVS